MLEGIPGWLGAIGGLFGVLVLVSAAVAVIWSTAAKTRTQLLEDTNKSLLERVDFLEREQARKDAEHEKERAVDKAEKDSLRQKVSVLERVVTGKEQLDHIQVLIEAHDRRVDLVAQNIGSNHHEVVDLLDEVKRDVKQTKLVLRSVIQEMNIRE